MTSSTTRSTLGSLALPALAAAGPAIGYGLDSGQELFGRGLINPDSAMRLVRLEDIVAAGAPLHAVMRDGSGAGSIMSWTHLLDSLLLLLAAPLAPWTGWPAALHAAGLACGPLSMAALGAAVAWTAAPLAAAGWLWLGAFAAGMAASLAGYGMLGVAHHHVLLAVVATMAAGWSVRLLRGHDPVGGGIALGSWSAFGLWLSPEALPFALLATGGLWAAWFLAPERRLATALEAAGATLLGLATLAWLADPPATGWSAVELDRLSLPFIVLAAGVALTAAAARATGRRAAAVGVGLASGLAWLAAFPEILHGTSALMPPDQAQAFFGRIREMQPISSFEGVAVELTQGLFALSALVALTVSRRDRATAALLGYAAICVAGLLALASLHLRFAAYPSAAGAVLLPVALTAVGTSWLPSTLQSLARTALVLIMIAAPRFAPLAASAGTRDASPAPCPLNGAADLLAGHAGAIVLAGINDTPDLLYRTQVRTVGSLYHRNPEGFMRLRAAWRSIPDDAAGPTPELLATQATLVLGCPGGPRSPIMAGTPQTTLLDRLIADRPPSWLHRLADAGPGGYVLYEVR